MVYKIRGRNEGSVSQRKNGSWRAQVTVNEKRLSKGFKTKAEALTWIRKMQDQLDQGFDINAATITIEDYLLKWLETCRISLRPKTVFQYEKIIRNHIIPRVGKIKIRDIRPVRMELMYSEMIQGGVGVRTVRVVHAVMHRAFDKAVRNRILPYNPITNLSLPRYQAEEMSIMDESLVSSFLVTAQTSHLAALFNLALVTGMRQGELFGLKWSDLQWSSGTLYVHRQVQHVPKQGWVFEEPKTRRGRRTIKLGEGVLQALRVQAERQKQLKDLAGAKWKENNLVFTSNVGTPLDPSNMRLEFNRILKAAGIPEIRFHDLRHTAASLMLNHGVPVIVVSGILGHAKASTTLDFYGHLMHGWQDEAAKFMDELITPIRVTFPPQIKVTRQKNGQYK